MEDTHAGTLATMRETFQTTDRADATRWLCPDGTRLTFCPYAGDSLLTHEDACDFAGLSFASVLQAGIIRYARGNRAGEGRIMVAASLTETQARIIVDDWGFFDTDLHVDVFGNVGSTSKLFEQRDINAATLLAYLWVTAS
jgi:hypothetical protein